MKIEYDSEILPPKGCGGLPFLFGFVSILMCEGSRQGSGGFDKVQTHKEAPTPPKGGNSYSRGSDPHNESHQAPERGRRCGAVGTFRQYDTTAHKGGGKHHTEPRKDGQTK